MLVKCLIIDLIVDLNIDFGWRPATVIPHLTLVAARTYSEGFPATHSSQVRLRGDLHQRRGLQPTGLTRPHRLGFTGFGLGLAGLGGVGGLGGVVLGLAATFAGLGMGRQTASR